MADKYRISVISEINKMLYIERELHVPGLNQVLVKVDACAICTLEQRVYSGQMKFKLPYAGGHEVSGHIVGQGSGVRHLANGDKVAVRLLTSCGECYYCRNGYDNQCVDSFKTSIHEGVPGGGGMAEYMLVDARAVFKVDDSLDPTHTALAEPLACCVHSINRGNIQFGDAVVVIGAGIMGAFHIMLAKLKGAKVIACEVSEERLQVAKSCGADILINTSKVDGVEAVKEHTAMMGADVVFNTVAISEVATQATQMVAKLGRVVLYSSFHPDKPLNLSPNHIHYSESVITGSVNPGIKDFLQATKLLSERIIDPSPFITDVVSFDQIEEGLSKALDPMSFRVVISMQDELNEKLAVAAG